ncbi:helix-turn-helix domain-containing protein [Vannielia litorea]|uniref:helix-turn-helix domain-containing protein n=1 Tax=Vannielia litorea TaxID=1217970 RepID=UPI001BCB4CA7|nr:helix-turn-helix transcriptional regulator [Vannielia litorea]MBS8227273.1 XRE family transcriptional regulator [Vannielia litorea]
MSEKASTIGARIKLRRKHVGLTQAELAQRAEVTRAALGQWEIGKTRPSIEKIPTLAKVLSVDCMWLTFGEPAERRAARLIKKGKDLPCLPVHFLQWKSPLKPPTRGREWRLSRDFFRDGTHSEDHGLCEVLNSSAPDPLQARDVVLIDRGDVNPIQAGIFVFWNGNDALCAHVQVLGTPDSLRHLFKFNNGVRFDCAPNDTPILGRVIAIMHRNVERRSLN